MFKIDSDVIIYFRVYNLTLATFVIAFGHFASEVFLYKTMAITTFGVYTPLIVSGMSIAM